VTAQTDDRNPTDPSSGASPVPVPATFDDVWNRIDEIPGWLTPAQGRALWDCASRVPNDGRIVEIGSFQGRSTCVLTSAASPAGARTTAIDPFISGLGLHKEDEISRERFETNLEKLGLRGSVDLTVARSVEARLTWQGTIDFLYIDGKHDTRTVLDDLKWVRDVREGGEVAIHDSFSSIGVTLGLLIGALPSGRLRYTGRAGSLALFMRGKPTVGSRLAMLGQLPWFVRNVFIKVLLRLRLRPIARVLGHRSPVDPY
jgi:predicted O-methyltransferase YrrM